MLTVDELNDRLIDLAFAEDIGDGDHTTLCCIPADAYGESKLLIKEEGIFAGVEIAKEVFRRFDPTMEVEVYIEDGTHVKPGDIVMSVKGKEQSLLQTERLTSKGSVPSARYAASACSLSANIPNTALPLPDICAAYAPLLRRHFFILPISDTS